MASMLLPSVAIHSGVKFSKSICTVMKCSARTTKIAPVVFGIGIIPCIIGPIDDGVSWVMNRFIRLNYPKEHYRKLVI